VAYYPSPLSAWNVRQNTLDPLVGASARAFTNAATPVKVMTQTTGSAIGVNPKEGWGDPTFKGGKIPVYLPTPPSYGGSSGNAAIWTLTMDKPLSGTTPDPAIQYIFAGTNGSGAYSNIVCLHADSGDAAYFNDLTGNPAMVGGYDITFDDMVWVNAARVVFEGIIGASVTRSTILRGPAISNGQAPCFSAGAGGFQFGQPNDPATWGNVVSGVTATATADDTVAMFNDNGTGTTLYPPSSITTTTITDADNRSINLDNHSAKTHLYVTPSRHNPACAITTNTVRVNTYNPPPNTQPPWYPVTISTPTQNTITNTGHCDPCQIQCPITVTGKT
jgi:hypothetical protein